MDCNAATTIASHSISILPMFSIFLKRERKFGGYEMNITDLLVTAESVETGERLTGYVCGCKQCRTAREYEKYNRSRPIGLLTHPEEKYGNVRVYTDTMEFVKNKEKLMRGLYIDDERKNVDLMRARFELYDIEICGIDDLPNNIDAIIREISTGSYDFLIIDFDLTKWRVCCNSDDIMMAIRGRGNDIYTILLTNFPIDEGIDLKLYDCEMQKIALSSPLKMRELIGKIKRGVARIEDKYGTSLLDKRSKELLEIINTIK